MQHMKSKVHKAHREASIGQLEEEVVRLEGLGKKSFDAWVAQLTKDAGSTRKAVMELPVAPDKLYDAVLEVVKGEGMRRRIRELEQHLSELLPMAERVKGAPGGAASQDLGFWKRVLRAVRQSMAQRRGSTFNKAQGAATDRTPAGQRSQIAQRTANLNDLSRLQGELAAIWASLPQKPEKAKGSIFIIKPVAQQVLQEAVKSFYLKSCGRQKQVEQAVFSLCRAVIDHSLSPKVALFAVVSDTLDPSTMADRIPEWTRDVENYLGRRLLKTELATLPSDAAFLMFDFMAQLKALRRTGKFPGAMDGSTQLLPHEGDASDSLLPLQLVLRAAQQSISKRSQALATCFSMMMFGYAQRPSLSSANKKSTTTLTAVSDDAHDYESEPEGPDETRRELDLQALLLSHFLAADLFHRNQEPEAFIDDAWSWATLKGDAEGETIASSRFTQVLLHRYPTVTLPYQFVQSSLQNDLATSPGEVSRQGLSELMTLWQREGGAASLACLESHAYWAALWALAYERAYEIDLMGQVFVLFDTSGDGWMQFSEFYEFMKVVAPDTSEDECAGLFMLAADDTAADMTKEVFVNLVLRTGLTSDVDQLEKLVKSVQAELGID